MISAETLCFWCLLFILCDEEKEGDFLDSTGKGDGIRNFYKIFRYQIPTYVAPSKGDGIHKFYKIFLIFFPGRM